MTFRRKELAEEMAKQLLKPRALDLSIRSGLFLGGQRRIGKTTFIRGDLVPALEALGAIVIYADLWSDTTIAPSIHLKNAVQATLRELQSPGSRVLAGLKRVRSLDLGAAGIKFGFKIEDVGTQTVTLAQVFTELVERARTDLVVIVDEVQHALGTEDGDAMLLGLKASRDAINTRPDTPGHFLFIGTGSHRARVRELTLKGNQAFNGAICTDFPVLDDTFVRWLLDAVRDDLGARLPSFEATSAAFKRLGNRPEDLMKALRALESAPNVSSPDEALGAATEALRQTSADIDLARLEQLGPLATAIFRRVALGDPNGVKGLFATETLKAYGEEIGRPVAKEEIQPLVAELVASNLLARDTHGVYLVSDAALVEPFRQRERMAQQLTGTHAADVLA